MPTDLRLPRLDDEAAAFIKAQAAMRGCTPQLVVERMVALTVGLVRDAKSSSREASDCATDYLERADLAPTLDYFPEVLSA